MHRPNTPSLPYDPYLCVFPLTNGSPSHQGWATLAYSYSPAWPSVKMLAHTYGQINQTIKLIFIIYCLHFQTVTFLPSSMLFRLLRRNWPQTQTNLIQGEFTITLQIFPEKKSQTYFFLVSCQYTVCWPPSMLRVRMLWRIPRAPPRVCSQTAGFWEKALFILCLA